NQIDTYLILLKPSETSPGPNTIFNDDVAPGSNTNSRIPVSGFITLPESGTYSILANLFPAVDRPMTGDYQLTLTFGGTGGTICPPTPTVINNGQTVNGVLDTNDCALQDGSRYDAYSFTATAGQQVSILMSSATVNGTSGVQDPYLLLLAPDGTDIAEDDNGGGGVNARIPAGGGVAVLPQTGTYTIYANTTAAGQTGGYSLTLNISGQCPTRSIVYNQTIGDGQLTNTDCRLPADGSFLDLYTFSGTAGQQISISLSAAAGSTLDPFLFLLAPDGTEVASNDNAAAGSTAARIPPTGTLTLPTTGTYTIVANSAQPNQTGAYTLTLNGPVSTCVSIFPPLRAFGPGASTSGRLTVVADTGTCAWTANPDVLWITITEGASGTGTGRVRYSVAANTTGATRIGHINIQGLVHTVTQTAAATTPTVQFSATNYTVSENNLVGNVNAARITLTRTGDTAGAVTVDYQTVDNPAEIGCFDTAGNQGAAFARCDYATSIDTVTFGIGETTKTFDIPLINDVHVEGNETFQVQLLNAQGATLGTSSATVTITDDDTAQATTNPINRTPFFVRLQYLDFLAREPEAGEPWTGVLNRCPDINTGPEVNTDCDRIAVSGAFFGSPEFQLKGTFVFLAHKAAFGSASNPNYVPAYVDFAADLRRVTGATPAEVFAKRLDFADDFVTRPAFVARYGGLSNAQYVDTLLANVNASLSSADPTTGVSRNSLVNDLNAGTKTRADVLRLIADSNEVKQKQFVFAFVATEYYGYLRRTPDAGGYQNWLTYLAAHPNDFRTMVNGFLNSTEYRLRFGPNTTQ
ncbi:MAG TPA: DUF4214 domain-containing protein, partial [Pyrinomonadaceae bacterium]